MPPSTKTIAEASRSSQIDLSETAGSIKIAGITDSDQVARREGGDDWQRKVIFGTIVVICLAIIAGLVGAIFAFA